MNKLLKYAPSHPVMFNRIFDDGEIMTDFLNSTGLFSITEPNSIQFTKQSIGDEIGIMPPLMDLNLTVDDQMFINIEMYNKKPDSYDLMCMLGKCLGKLVEKSQEVFNCLHLNNCVVFAITNFKMFTDDECLRSFIMTDDDNNNQISHFKIILLELPKISFCKKDSLKKWMNFLNSTDPLTLIEDETITQKDNVLKKAVFEAARLNASDELANLLTNYEKS